MFKVILLSVILSLSLKAEISVWRVNKDHSELFFKVPYLSLSHVTGRFTKYTGRISFTDEQVFPSNIRLKIDSSSVFTGSKIRDGHLKAKDFFDAKSFPSMSFISDNVIAKGPGKFEVWGLLTITKFKKRIMVLIEITESTKDSWKFENKFISFKTSIDRSEFGLNWNKSLQNNEYLVGNNIEIWGNFQVQPLNSLTPAFKYMIPNTKYTQLKNKLTLGDISLNDFKKEIEILSNKPSQEKETKEKTSESASIKEDSLPYQSQEVPSMAKKDDHSSIWWMAYYVMGFIGLLAMIIICFQGKYYFMKIWPDSYKEENTILGLSGDFIAYGVAFIYVWAMWVIAYS